MQQDPRTILLKVFTLVNFEDDKEAYADRFIKNCEQQALVDVISTLPKEKQVELTQKMVWTQDPKRQKAIVTEYIPQQAYIEALKKAAEKAFRELIEAVKPTLSNEQVDKLNSYLKTFSPQ